MRISIAIALSLFSVFSSIAGVKLESGSRACLAGSKRVGITYVWDQAVYCYGGNLDDFLHRARREANWEEVSFRDMAQEFNSETLKYGIRMVWMDHEADAPYYFVMVVRYIDENGDVEGKMALRCTANDNVEAVLRFSSDDADDNDEYVFRDQFESIGEALGKSVVKAMKKSRQQ